MLPELKKEANCPPVGGVVVEASSVKSRKSWWTWVMEKMRERREPHTTLYRRHGQSPRSHPRLITPFRYCRAFVPPDIPRFADHPGHFGQRSRRSTAPPECPWLLPQHRSRAHPSRPRTRFQPRWKQPGAASPWHLHSTRPSICVPYSIVADGACDRCCGQSACRKACTRKAAHSCEHGHGLRHSP